MNIPQNAEMLLRGSPLRGISCSFIRVSEKWGIKAYISESKRDEAFASQIEYASKGFSPPTGECFCIGAFYCYGTRVAEILIDPKETDDLEWYATEEEYQTRINNRIDQMYDAGLFPCDYHVANWGWFEDELMLIDLGSC